MLRTVAETAYAEGYVKGTAEVNGRVDQMLSLVGRLQDLESETVLKCRA